MKKIFILLLLVSILAFSACSNDEANISKEVDGTQNNVDAANNEDKENGEDTKKPIMAPDFELMDMEGNTVKLSDFLGKKVMINFWATWCKFCVDEMPDLMKLQEAHKDDLVILYVNVGETKEKVQEFIDEKNLSGIILLDEKREVSSKYGVDAYPTTFAVNEKGEMITYWRGMMEYSIMEQMYNIIK